MFDGAETLINESPCSITTGKNHAALLTNSAEWENVVVEAGLSSGEMVKY